MDSKFWNYRRKVLKLPAPSFETTDAKPSDHGRYPATFGYIPRDRDCRYRETRGGPRRSQETPECPKRSQEKETPGGNTSPNRGTHEVTKKTTKRNSNHRFWASRNANRTAHSKAACARRPHGGLRTATDERLTPLGRRRAGRQTSHKSGREKTKTDGIQWDVSLDLGKMEK